MRILPLAVLALGLIACGSDDDKEGARSCTPSEVLEDDCGGTSICIPDAGAPGTGTCEQQRACGPDGSCAVGSTGAVCSEGILDREQHICLQGLCATANDCPSGFVCDSLSGVVGVCTESGTVDAPCESEVDCGDGLDCMAPFHGADFTVCIDPTPPGDGSCDYDLHCGDGAFCDWESERCLEGSGMYCDDDEACFADELCHDTSGVCYVP